MTLKARNIKSAGKKKDRAPALEPGTYPARLVGVLDLGLQPQRPYKGQEKPPAHMLNLTYELADEFLPGEDGEDDESKPRWVSEELPFYGLDVDKAYSTQRYLSMDPEEELEGDWEQLVGRPLMVTVVNNTGKNDIVYENVAGTSKMTSKKASKAPELVNEPRVFTLDDPDMEVFNGLPDFLKEKIKGNLEFKGSDLEAALGGGSDDSEDEGDDDEW